MSPPPAGALPAAGRGFVQVPTALLADRTVSSNAVALWCVLVRAGRRSKTAKVSNRLRPTLMTEIGLDGRDEDTVSQASGQLVAAGWLAVEQKRVANKTRNTYEPLRVPAHRDGQRYAEVPWQALEQLKAGQITSAHLRSLGGWLDACGSQGRTTDTLSQHAETCGIAIRAARLYRVALVRAGLLEVTGNPGRASSTCRPGSSPTPAPGAVPLRPVQAPDPGTRTGTTPATGAAPPRHQERRSSTTSRKNNLPKEAPGVVLSRRDRTSSDARERDAAPAAPNGKSSRPGSTTEPAASGLHRDADRVLGAVLDVLAPMPRWFRTPVKLRLSEALGEGYGPVALIQTLKTHFRTQSAAEGKHLAELSRTLGCLRADVLAGACWGCGQEPTGELVQRRCVSCSPKDRLEDQGEVDPAELARLLHGLGLPAQAEPVNEV